MNKKKILIVIICLVVLGTGFFFWKKETDSVPVIQHVVAEGMKTYSDHGFSIDYPEELGVKENNSADGKHTFITFEDGTEVDYAVNPESFDVGLKDYGRYVGIEKYNGYNFHLHKKAGASAKEILTYSLKTAEGGYVVYLADNSMISLNSFFLK